MPRWWAAACDIRDQHAPQLLLEEAREHYGRLDILVNAGSQVGPVQNAQIGSYQSALDTMALSMVRMSLAALPVMRAQIPEHHVLADQTADGRGRCPDTLAVVGTAPESGWPQSPRLA